MEKEESISQRQQSSQSTQTLTQSSHKQVNKRLSSQRNMGRFTSDNHNERYCEENENPSMTDGYESCDGKEPESPRSPTRFTKRPKAPKSGEAAYNAIPPRGRPFERGPRPSIELSGGDFHRASGHVFDMDTQRLLSGVFRAVHLDPPVERVLWRELSPGRDLEGEKKRRQTSFDKWSEAGDKLWASSSRNRQ